MVGLRACMVELNTAYEFLKSITGFFLRNEAIPAIPAILLGALFGLIFINQLSVISSRAILSLLGVFVMCEIALSVYYLYFPSFVDHLEASIANLGLIYQSGDFLYPLPIGYSYHGTLYGPLLAQIQSFSQSLAIYVQSDVILNAKIPGVLAFVLSGIMLFFSISRPLPRMYLALIIAFGLVAFWNRADSYLLFFCCFGIFLCVHLKGIYIYALLGILAGLSAALKIHGVLYIAALAVFIGANGGSYAIKLGYFIIGTIFAFALTFSPQQVSLPNFFEYLSLAGRHGLSMSQFLINSLYLVVVFMPLAYMASELWRTQKKTSIGIMAVGTIEALVALMGSKPGSNVTHLLPLIPINAYILQELDFGVATSKKIAVVYKVAILFALLGPIPHTLNSYYKLLRNNHEEQRQMRNELVGLAHKSPGSVLLPTNNAHFSYVYLRPLLEADGTRQVDYSTFMDLNFSGVADNELLEAIQKCSFSFVITPKNGDPLSLISVYTNRRFFSDASRKAFTRHFQEVDSSAHFRVYRCQQSAG